MNLKNLTLYLVIIFSINLFAQSPGHQLMDFDNTVRNSRVEMRKYCALVTQLMNENDEAKKNEAVTHISNSIERWSEVSRFYSDVPKEYSADQKFAEKLNQLYGKLEVMKNKLVDNQYKDSFDACAAACGLFVKLHEENNLDYAVDKLFNLRKVVKKLQNDLTNNNASDIEKGIKSMLLKRNDVVAVDTKLNPGLSDNEEYQNYIMEISSMIDEIAFTYSNKKEIQLEQKLNDLFTTINKAYSLAL